MLEVLSSLPEERRWKQQRHPMPSVLALIRETRSPMAQLYPSCRTHDNEPIATHCVHGGDHAQTMTRPLQMFSADPPS